jgi:hypothetical protein
MATGTAIVDFSAGLTETSVAVTGQTGILSTSQAGCALRSEATATNSTDDIYLDPVDVEVIGLTAGTGFTILARARNGKAFGTYKVDWAWA